MAEEDKSLREYVEAHGEGNWNQVQRNTGLNRCGKSCRLRWANNLRPDLKTGPFDDEDQRIIERHAMMGNKWAQMAACELGLLPGSPVGTSLIDAHAGGVGVLESVPDPESKKQYATTWSWFVEHLHATWLSQRTNYLSLMSGGPFLRWYLSFGSLKVAKVQLVLYLITLLKTMLLLPFLLITLLLKVYPYMSC